MSATVKVRGWEMEGGTPRALKVAHSLPPTLAAAVSYEWIPLSLCVHISRRHNPGEIWPEVIIELPAWKARQMNLEEVD
jgi:hypothetical protein